MPKRRAISRRTRAFTLFELVIAMTVFSLVAVALFRVLDSCLRTANALHDSERITHQVAAFAEICRKTFSTLPAEATFRVEPSLEADGQEMLLRGAPAAFAFGDTPLNFGATTLAIRPLEEGGFEVAVSRSDFAPPEEENALAGMGLGEADAAMQPDEQGRYWLTLLGNLEWARWRFYDRRAQDWVEEWTRKERPPLVEFSLLLEGDTVPFRAVFPVAATGQDQNQPAPAPASTNRRGGNRNRSTR